MSDLNDAVATEVSTETVRSVIDNVNQPTETDANTTKDDVTDPVSAAVEHAVTEWVGFDPEIHAVNPDGTPRLRTNGSYALKRGGAGAKRRQRESETKEQDASSPDNITATSPAPAPGGDTQNAPVSAPPATPVSSRDAAAAIVLMTTTIAERVIGPEWRAEKAEIKNLTDASARYLDSKGGVQLTPEVALSLAIMSYAAPRFAHDNTRGKLARMWDWARDRIAVIKARFA